MGNVPRDRKRSAGTGALDARRAVLCFWIAASAVIAGPELAVAQPGAAVAVGQEAGSRARVEELVRRSRENPTDLDTLYELAAAAIAAQDLETAIGALERLLIFNPALPRVRLELGVLYFRLGSYDIARLQLERAIEGADVPETVREQVARYLDAIEERTATHVISGEILLAGRYQTNPRTVSDPTNVQVGGLLFETDDEKQADASLVALATVTHVRRFATQWDDALVTRVQLYAERFRELSSLSSTVAELESGPSLALARFDLPPATVRPFLNAAYVALDDAYFTQWIGPGIELRAPFGERLQLRTRGRARYQDYTETDDSQNGDRTGWRGDVGFGGTLLMTPQDFLDGFAYVETVDADASFRAYEEIGGSLVLGHRFTVTNLAPLELVTVYAGGSAARSRYRGADPVIEPDTRRRDWSYGARAGAIVDLGRRLAVVGEVEYRMTNSSVGIYEYDNTSMLLGLKVKF